MSILLTEEDKYIAFENIILNLVIKNLEKDIAAIESSKLRLRKFHVQNLNKIHKDFSRALSDNKKLMRQKGISVMDRVILSEDFWGYRYIVRGFNSEFRFFKYALKNHVEKMLNNYLEQK